MLAPLLISKLQEQCHFILPKITVYYFSLPVQIQWEFESAVPFSSTTGAGDVSAVAEQPPIVRRLA